MLRLITAATAEPVTLDEAKTHLRIIDTSLDALIQLWITAAREEVEQVTGYALSDAEWEWTPDDADATAPIRPMVVTSDEGVTPVTFKGAPGPTPATLKAAILLRLDDLKANTSAGVSEPLSENPAFQSLIWSFRRVRP